MRLRLFAPLLACLAAAGSADDTSIPLPQLIGSAALVDSAAVWAFYESRGFRPAWAGENCPARLAQLVSAIEESAAHGLDASIYHHDALARDTSCQSGVEPLATDAWLSLAAHLQSGRVDPVTVEPGWTALRPGLDRPALLERALAAGTIRDSLLGLAPDQPGYRALQAALVRFRQYVAEGGWTGVDDGPTLRLGDQGPRVQQLRSRLARSGLLDPGQADSDAFFDDSLEGAVKAFQRRANLEPDGLVGPMTLKQLNLGVAHRVEQLRVNLERWRWLPEDLGERHVRVNIANFRLEARANAALEREHRVIVGKPARPTPVFSGRITYLVFNPWWETPRRLAVQDKLPLFSRDPSAVERLGFEVVDQAGIRVDPDGIDWRAVSPKSFPYRLRQRPGPLNALGQVKLMFPNPHDVYLHDTPNRELFGRVRRDFSSGCIRVEGALDLAAWVLEITPGWDRARIDAAVASGAVTQVSLASPLPVHILYLTAVAGEDGGVRFLDDLYDRDAALAAALDARPALRQPVALAPAIGSSVRGCGSERDCASNRRVAPSAPGEEYAATWQCVEQGES